MAEINEGSTTSPPKVWSHPLNCLSIRDLARLRLTESKDRQDRLNNGLSYEELLLEVRKMNTDLIDLWAAVPWIG